MAIKKYSFNIILQNKINQNGKTVLLKDIASINQHLKKKKRNKTLKSTILQKEDLS